MRRESRDENGNIHKGDRVMVLPQNGDEAAEQFLAPGSWAGTATGRILILQTYKVPSPGPAP